MSKAKTTHSEFLDYIEANGIPKVVPNVIVARDENNIKYTSRTDFPGLEGKTIVTISREVIFESLTGNSACLEIEFIIEPLQKGKYTLYQNVIQPERYYYDSFSQAVTQGVAKLYEVMEKFSQAKNKYLQYMGRSVRNK